ncbi:MAG: AzlC family ABC transporter permease [Nocardioidaceae bacterium]|nr:AzlC family ABC transporter permease [Nocardioidaceae bacterium]
MSAAVAVRSAAREVGVVWLGLVALGTGFGVVVTGYGFPWWLAPLISLTVFAGSVEFILVGMLAGGASIAAIALTTFVVNSRHLFYGLTFPLHRVEGRLPRAYSVFALIDEAYALTAGKDPAMLSSGRILATQAGLHLSWVGGSLLGALAGSLLGDVEGLDFVLTALFVVLALDAYDERPDRVTLLLATGAAGLAFLVAPGSMVLVAMSVFAATLLIRHRRGRQHA